MISNSTCALSCEPIQSTLWFDDGNLIVHAPPVQFKVYAGILAARSSVFRDMLAFPPPEGGNEHVEGCVVVRLYGDDPREVKWFLRAVLDSSFFEPPPTSTTLPIVYAILRLSRKYDVPYLYTRALAHLQTTFPTTYAGWLERDDKRTIPPVDNTPFAALRIAREFGLDWMVPSVMYCISSHPIEKSMDGAGWCPPDDDEEQWAREGRSNGEEEKEKAEMIELTRHEQKMAVCCRAELSVMQNQAGVELIRSGMVRECESLPGNMPQATATPDAAATAGNGNGAVPINVNVPINGPPGAALFPPGGALTPNPPPGNGNPFNNIALPPIIPPPTNNAHPNAVPINIVPPTANNVLPVYTCPHTRLRLAEIIASLTMAGFLDFYNERGAMISNGLCAPCKEVVKRECERLAGEMWDSLPRFCGLEGWSVLEGRRKSAMGL